MDNSPGYPSPTMPVSRQLVFPSLTQSSVSASASPPGQIRTSARPSPKGKMPLMVLLKKSPAIPVPASVPSVT